jgi:hypothetical protein
MYSSGYLAPDSLLTAMAWFTGIMVVFQHLNSNSSPISHRLRWNILVLVVAIVFVILPNSLVLLYVITLIFIEIQFQNHVGNQVVNRLVESCGSCFNLL